MAWHRNGSGSCCSAGFVSLGSPPAPLDRRAGSNFASSLLESTWLPHVVRVPGTTRHVPVQGKFAKASATYVPALAHPIGHCFGLAISAKLRALAETDVDVAGLEDIVSNDLAQTLTWSCQAEWTWPRQVHINILESSAIYGMLKLVASRHLGPISCVNLCDSNAALCAENKGRSPSDGLRPVLRRIGALKLAAGIYNISRYCATRLMPADAPTRDIPIASPGPGFGLDFWTSDAVRNASALSPLRRWAANWLRLVLLLQAPILPYRFRQGDRFQNISYRAYPASLMDFDATLGFPSEGPPSVWPVAFLSLWTLFSV